jgi:predicted deacylase
VLPGGPPNVDGEPPQYVSYDTMWPRPAHGGFWEQDVDLGQVVEEGQVIGRVRNLFGETVEELRAPFRSVITDVRHTATIQTGEWNVKCARIENVAESRRP